MKRSSQKRGSDIRSTGPECGLVEGVRKCGVRMELQKSFFFLSELCYSRPTPWVVFILVVKGFNPLSHACFWLEASLLLRFCLCLLLSALSFFLFWYKIEPRGTF